MNSSCLFPLQMIVKTPQVRTDTSASTASSRGSDGGLTLTSPCSYTIVGDSWDKTINPRYMHSDYQRHRLFHMYAALDRVNTAELPSEQPVGTINTLRLQTFLPSSADCKELRSHYAILLGRVLVEKMPFFII